MKADITRNTFDPDKQFTRVLMQQGRVQLDSDWNEQVSILLHYMRTLAADLIGPHGGPTGPPNGHPNEGTGFCIDFENGEMTIGPGRYYVDGILCENPERTDEEGDRVEVTYGTQPFYPLSEDEADLPPVGSLLVYLDVWEQHVTAVEDTGIREVALGGPDTTTRARVVWQVKVDDGEGANLVLSLDSVKSNWKTWIERWQPTNRGLLVAKSREEPEEEDGNCVVPPEARYRGLENQLYRVEIHSPGIALGTAAEPRSGPTTETAGEDLAPERRVATFKWSRDNGSVTFPIRALDGSVVTLEGPGRDERLGLEVGDLVEVVDDDYVLREEARPLLRVEGVDDAGVRITLEGEPAPDVGRDEAKHPLLRRWDHGSGAAHDGAAGYDTIPLREDTWLTLEDGVQIYFRSDSMQPDAPAPHRYRTGDYWLIPARTATGDLDWPEDEGRPRALPPHGVQHHYAPLAIVAGGYQQGDCRCRFDSPLVCPPIDNH